MTLKEIRSVMVENNYIITGHFLHNGSYERIEYDINAPLDPFCRVLDKLKLWEQQETDVTFIHFNRAYNLIEINVDILMKQPV